ncbi:MAG: right-handed parallel beta-helix repeat-containing protein [Anaerolineae bacterium]|nr:right-handed parallel beta-helix repeat-containing protein [Anaerolineae bacterium]
MARNRTILMVALLLSGLLVTIGAVAAEPGGPAWRLFAPMVSAEGVPCHVVVAPGQSIQAAVDNSRSGQVICVRAGTYHERIRITPAAAGITLMAYPGERPMIDGEHKLPERKWDGMVQISGSHVVFDGFEVRNSAQRGMVIAPTGPASPRLQGVVVRNSIITSSLDTGITIQGPAESRPRNIIIEGNVVYANLLKNPAGTSGGSAFAFIATDDSVARGNYIFHNRGEGLVIDRGAANTTVEDNVIYDNAAVNLYLNDTQNPLVQRNLVFCTDDRAYWGGQPPRARAGDGLHIRDESFSNLGIDPPRSTGQVIINNIVIGCGWNFGVDAQIPGGGLNNALVANNTFINARGDDQDYTNNIKLEGRASYNNSRFVNNLIVQTVPGAIAAILTVRGTPDLSTFSIGHNLYSKAPNPNHAWPAGEPGRLIADPLLVNPVLPVRGTMPKAADYGLRVGSPAIDKGVPVDGVTTDFFGRPRRGAPDVGAVEFIP